MVLLLATTWFQYVHFNNVDVYKFIIRSNFFWQMSTQSNAASSDEPASHKDSSEKESEKESSEVDPSPADNGQVTKNQVAI